MARRQRRQTECWGGGASHIIQKTNQNTMIGRKNLLLEMHVNSAFGIVYCDDDVPRSQSTMYLKQNTSRPTLKVHLPRTRILLCVRQQKVSKAGPRVVQGAELALNSPTVSVL